MVTLRGSLEGGNGEVEMGRGATGTERKWQWEVGQRGGARWRAMGGGGRWEGGNLEGGSGKRWEGRGRKRRKKEEGGFTDRYDGMPGWT